MSADPAVHLHELRCPACRIDLGSIHRREDESREVVAFFYPPGGADLGEPTLIRFLQAVQRGAPDRGVLPPCPRCGEEVHEGCLVSDIQVLQPRRDRKGRRRRGPR